MSVDLERHGRVRVADPITKNLGFDAGVKHAACGGAGVAESAVSLACPLGRSRVLRAAWRPCSRGPAPRAEVVPATPRFRPSRTVSGQHPANTPLCH
jgi:hypothetical protein